jgi:hypothetical protein
MTLTKASVFIRTVGSTDSSAAFSIPQTGYVAFDAANFYKLEQGDPSVVFEVDANGSYGSGALHVEPIQSRTNYPVITYPVIAEKAGKYNVFIRVKTGTSVSSFTFDILIDGFSSSTETRTVTPGNWSWIETTIVVKDDRRFDLSIKPQTADSYIDSFIITSEAIPSSIEYQSKFLTLHFRMFEMNSSMLPGSSLPIYGFKTTIDEIKDDNWYNFALDPLPGYSSISFDMHYVASLFVSGISDSLYLIWDYASNEETVFDPYNVTCSLLYDSESEEWLLDCEKSYAIKFYSHRDAIDENACKIIVPASALATNRTQKFDTASLEPLFAQTKIATVDNESNKVELSLPDRLLSVVMDQSGSMSWNDSQGLRHTLTRRMVDRLEATYPGEVKYNLLSLGSTPIKINFFAVVENDQINTSNTSAVATSFFADQESGYAGVRIIRKKGSYPTGPLDGEIVTEGFVERAFDDELEEGEEYFYAAYTFDSNQVFSNGRFLTATPRVKLPPRGVGGFTYRVITGSGIKRDENTIGLWHLNESVGQSAYDFSDNPITLNSSFDNLVWLNKNDVPSGISGIRFDGNSTRIFGYDGDGKLVQTKYTFMAWVYPFDFVDKRTIISRETPSLDKMTFRFGTNTDGTLYLTMDDLTFASSSGTLTSNAWNHVAVTVDLDTLTATFYINGEASGNGSVATLGFHSIESMDIYIGGKTSSFFGKITEVSVHDVVRPSSYIYSASIVPEDWNDKVLDNGDRIVALRFSVPDDYNFPGGKVLIIRKEEVGSGNFEYVTPTNSDGTVGDPVLVFNGFGEKPSNETDGVAVYNENASAGEHTVILPYDYVHGRVYDFRIYSQSAIGNYSLSSDSPILSITIPTFANRDARNAAISTPFVNSVGNVQIRAGNHKSYLTWNAINDDVTDQVLVFWSDTGPPIINNDQGVSSSAMLVYSGNPSESSFVDRNIENEIVNYYAVIAADRYGNFSAPVYVSTVPLNSADETDIPLLETKQFRYEVVNENAISLAWDAPVKFQKEIEAWFDQRVALYAQITDEYGAAIADSSRIKFDAKATVSSAQLAEDVFGETINYTTLTPEAKNCFALSSSDMGDGFIKGIFRMTSDQDVLSAINTLSATIYVSYTIPDRENPSVNVFEFTSLPIQIEMQNPFTMEMINIGDNTTNFGTNTSIGLRKKSRRRRSSSSSVADPTVDNNPIVGADMVKILCKQTVPLDNQEFISTGGLLFDPNKFKEFDGCWIRRTRPFVARVVVTYRGQSLPGGADCNAAVFEASDPQCDPEDNSDSNPCSQTGSGSSRQPPFEPSFSTRRSRAVQPPATSIPLRTGLQRLNDGTTRQVSYADIPLRAPRSPQAVMLFGKVSFNGYSSRKKQYIVFENILRVETTIEPPESNCIDVSEQRANVYMIDPDSPNVDNPRKIPVPNQQVVRWSLRKGRNSKDRPFYSSDNVPTGPGVFSYTRSGTARNVFFGPACGVTWELYIPCPGNIIYLPEMYAIKASVVYDGLSAFEERPAIIYPPSFGGRGFGSRFLMDMPQYVNPLYADGYDLVRCTIYHDPNIAGGTTAGCFRQCAENASRPIFVLDNGQIVDIESGNDFEILHGENLEIVYDEDLGENVVNNANQSIGFAQIPLSQEGNTTVFYFRINKFLGRPQSSASSDDGSENNQTVNSCECIEVPPGLAKKKDLSIVNGRTTINFNGETRYLRGGGDLKTGVPPTTIDLKEPLDIFVVDIRRDGQSVNKILCDGVAVHEFVLEVKFKENPVPNGTPVFLTVAGKNPEKIILQSDTIYTSKADPDEQGRIKSYASFFVAPFGPESAFEAQVQAETKYDKRGDVERSMTCCVTIKYDPSQKKEEEVVDKPEGEINNVFNASLDVYDTYNDTWVTKSSMQHPRGCLTLNWMPEAYSDTLYAIGGLNGKSVLSYNEMYDTASDIWVSKTSMGTPRFYHMSAEDGNYIYVFGGITVDGSDLLVTSSVERYNVYTDTWEDLPDMPVFDQNTYGVALGSCVVIEGKAYIIGGIRKIGQSGSIDALNDRILVFDFDTLTWSWSDAFTGGDLTLYARVSPFIFADSDGTRIHVIGGAVPGELNAETGEQPLEFITDTFVIDVSNLSISLDDYLFDQIPIPRYRGMSASIVDHHYFLGGTNSKSQVLNLVDRIGEDSPTYSYDSISRMLTARTAFGGTSDNWRYLYVCGGITSGRPKGFLQINASVSPSNILLDGKQSATVSIELLNDVGERPTQSIRVLVQGVLLFPDSTTTSNETSGGDNSQQQSEDSALRDALVYPVVFSSNDFYIYDGIGSTVMLPRADDILKKISEIKEKLGITDQQVAGEGGSDGNTTLKINEGEVRNPYSIMVRITVLDSFFYGQTVVDVKDNQDSTQTPPPEQPAEPSPTDPSPSEPTNPTEPVVEFEGCRSVEGSQTVPPSDNQQTNDPGRDNENNQTIDQSLKDKDNPVFDLNPPQTPQLSSPTVYYFSDIEWIPQVVVHVNNGEYSDMIQSLSRIENEIPFGASPLYDALIKNAEIMLDEDLDRYVKVIYLNTDNEENLSINTIDTAIQDIQAIDGYGKTPVITSNFSVVFPVTLSSLVARTDTDSLEKIASETGGQSQTVLDASFVDEVLNNTIGRVEGSIGWGLYECVIDLGNISIINAITLDYELYPNTDGNWKISTSDDGFNYSDYSDAFNPNTEVSFTNVSGRFIKFKVNLLSGLSSYIENEYDLIPTPGVPALTGINIQYSVPTESFIYFNNHTTDFSPQQIAVSVSANKPDLSTIEVGATTSSSYNWKDYYSGSQPYVDRFGKIFIPIRYEQENDSSLNESLENIDGFMWRAKYGKWDVSSRVTILDEDLNTVDPATYAVYPNEGFIVFNSKKVGSFFISIENAGNLRLGVRILNMDSNNPVIIDGLGYMYNTNVFLPPPLSQRPPVVSDFRVIPSQLTLYQSVGLTYKFFDINQRQEDKSQTQIRWYINGVEIEYLRDLREWNNINNTNDPIWTYAFSFRPDEVPAGTSYEQYAREKEESILKVGDFVYATIRASDGVLFGDTIRSPSVTVIEAPPSIVTIAIKGKKNDGTVSDNVTTATRAFAEYSLFQDGSGKTKSVIIWYVNGVEFKRGNLGETVSGFSNDEILVGEVRNNVVGITMGNVLEVTIVPASGDIIGNPVTSAAVSVENDPPSVRNVTVSPNPTAPSSSALQVTYTYVDVESQVQGSTQNDQSSIKWFRAVRGSSTFEEVTSLQNTRIIAATNTSSGQKWKAQIIPFDGVSVGQSVDSNTVEIV